MSAARLKMMLFSHICSGTHITGAEKLLLFFANELKASHECLLVVPNEGLLSAEARAREIPTLVIPYPNFYEMYAPGPYFPQAMEAFIHDSRDALGGILGVLLEHRPDLIVSNTCVNLLPAWAAKALGIPVSWMITEQIQPTRQMSMAAAAISGCADWIIGISDASMQPFRGGGAESKIRILYPSWNEAELERDMWPYYRNEKRSEIGWDESLRVIGYVSSDIYPNKGLEHFIQMALQLAPVYPDTRFMVAGKPTDAVYYDKCLQMIRTAGLSTRFYIHPFEVQIQRLYPSMDLVVIPSLIEEGFGMTALEGLAFGKSVVTYSSGGLNEIMHLTGNSSFLVEKGSVRGLVQVVGSLLAGGDYIRGWGERNRTAAQDAFGIDSYRQRVNEWLQQADATRHLFGPAPLPQEALQRRPAVLVKGSAPAVYMLERGYKYLFPNEAVFRHWGGAFEQVCSLHDAHIAALPAGGELHAGHTAPVRVRRGKALRRRRRVSRWGKGKRALAAARRKHSAANSVKRSGKRKRRVVTKGRARANNRRKNKKSG